MKSHPLERLGHLCRSHPSGEELSNDFTVSMLEQSAQAVLNLTRELIDVPVDQDPEKLSARWVVGKDPQLHPGKENALSIAQGVEQSGRRV